MTTCKYSIAIAAIQSLIIAGKRLKCNRQVACPEAKTDLNHLINKNLAKIYDLLMCLVYFDIVSIKQHI
jgi:uncharacterized membrane protein YkvI